MFVTGVVSSLAEDMLFVVITPAPSLRGDERVKLSALAQMTAIQISSLRHSKRHFTF